MERVPKHVPQRRVPAHLDLPAQDLPDEVLLDAREHVARLVVVLLGREVQRRLSVHVPRVHVRAAVDEELGRVRLAVEGGEVEGRAAEGVAEKG